MGTVQDVADAVCFTCTSSWMSGSILTIDGGMIARANMPFRQKPPKPDRINTQIVEGVSNCVNFDDLTI